MYLREGKTWFRVGSDSLVEGGLLQALSVIHVCVHKMSGYMVGREI